MVDLNRRFMGKTLWFVFDAIQMVMLEKPGLLLAAISLQMDVNHQRVARVVSWNRCRKPLRRCAGRRGRVGGIHVKAALLPGGDRRDWHSGGGTGCARRRRGGGGCIYYAGVIEQAALVAIIGIRTAMASETGGEIMPQICHPHLAVFPSELVGVIFARYPTFLASRADLSSARFR
jgi:hypothetical protein